MTATQRDNLIKWGMNFGLGSVFALLLLGMIYRLGERSIEAQEKTAGSTAEMSKTMGAVQVLLTEAESRDADHTRRDQLVDRRIEAIEKTQEEMCRTLRSLVEKIKEEPRGGHGT